MRRTAAGGKVGFELWPTASSSAGLVPGRARKLWRRRARTDCSPAGGGRRAAPPRARRRPGSLNAEHRPLTRRWGLVYGLPQWQALHSDHYEFQVGALVARAGTGCCCRRLSESESCEPGINECQIENSHGHLKIKIHEVRCFVEVFTCEFAAHEIKFAEFLDEVNGQSFFHPFVCAVFNLSFHISLTQACREFSHRAQARVCIHNVGGWANPGFAQDFGSCQLARARAQVYHWLTQALAPPPSLAPPRVLQAQSRLRWAPLGSHWDAGLSWLSQAQEWAASESPSSLLQGYQIMILWTGFLACPIVGRIAVSSSESQ